MHKILAYLEQSMRSKHVIAYLTFNYKYINSIERLK